MSDPILPLRQWQEGITQSSIPANDNALRNEALSMPALGVANDESGPADGDIWIVGDTPAGAFANFDEHDIALYRDGWHAWSPVEGVRLVVNDVRKVFDGAEWIDDPAGGGSGAVDSVNGQTGSVQIDAEDVPYDNTASGLAATDTQAAIDELAAAPPGAGDVVGPASSVAQRIVVFDDTTGKEIADGGKTIAEVKLIEQNSQSTAYTLVLTDAGKHLLHPSADTTARTFTIPANSSVAYPIGTAITFVNQNAAGVLTIAITTDTMRLAGAGTTGSRTLATNGMATALKITSTEWIISGTGLT